MSDQEEHFQCHHQLEKALCGDSSEPQLLWTSVCQPHQDVDRPVIRKKDNLETDNNKEPKSSYPVSNPRATQKLQALEPKPWMQNRVKNSSSCEVYYILSEKMMLGGFMLQSETLFNLNHRKWATTYHSSSIQVTRNKQFWNQEGSTLNVWKNWILKVSCKHIIWKLKITVAIYKR